MSRWLCGVLLVSGVAAGGEPSVPIQLQVELTSKVTKFDRNFAARVGDVARVLIAVRSGVVDSERVGKQLKATLEAQPKLGGVAHTEELVPYTTAKELSVLAREKKAALIILAPGVSTDGAAIARAFEGYDGLTISTSAEGVEQGVVLGFDLVSGKPQMLLNLDQARKQNADFRSEVLKLMKVFP